MRDEYEARMWQAFHHQYGEAAVTMIRAVAHAFDRLHARLYDAPWRRERETC